MARIQRLPSSSLGRNSRPSERTATTAARATISASPRSVDDAVGEHEFERRVVDAAQRAHQRGSRVSSTLLGNSSSAQGRGDREGRDQAAGDGIAHRSSPSGPKMCPSMPDRVNSGTKPAMMMAAAKKIDWLTSAAATRDRCRILPRKPLRHAHAVQMLGPVPRCAERPRPGGGRCSPP